MSNVGNNPYYYEKFDERLINISTLQEANMRENVVYFWNIMTNLVANNGSIEQIKGTRWFNQINTGRLYKNDTDLNKNTGEKIKALYFLLDKSEENRKKFRNSYFYKAVEYFAIGSMDPEAKDGWKNFEKTPNCDPLLKNKTALSIAFTSYRQDSKDMPLGVNIDLFLDAIIKKDARGNYKLVDVDYETALKMFDAVKNHYSDMKENKNFKANRYNKYLDEDEKY